MENTSLRIGNNVAIRSECIIEAKYSLSGKENDIVDILLTEIQKDEKLEYELSVKKYKNLYGYKDDSVVYRDLQKAVEGLGMKRIYAELINRKKSYAWFPKIEYRDREGKIIVEIHKDVKRAMIDFKKCIYYNIKYTLPLKNDFAKRFYYYAKSFEDTKHRYDSLEVLRDKLELGNKYPKYADFKRFVLEVVKEQINEITDIDIDFKEQKRDKENKNKVTHLETIIRKKTSEELSNIDISHSKETDKNINMRLEIIKLFEENTKSLAEITDVKKKNAENKKQIAKQLLVSVKTVNIYMNLSENLIEPILKMLDNKELTLNECVKWSKLDKKKQFESLENIKVQVRIKEEGKKDFVTMKEKKKIIDVEYTDVNNEISTDLYTDKTPKIKDDENIEEIKQYLLSKNFNAITSEKVEEIYYNGKKDIQYIKYIIDEASENNEIRVPTKWITEMVKPNVYEKPIKTNSKNGNKGQFNNFEQRKYDFDDLERKLLGWDNDNN